MMKNFLNKLFGKDYFGVTGVILGMFVLAMVVGFVGDWFVNDNYRSWMNRAERNCREILRQQESDQETLDCAEKLYDFAHKQD